MMMEVIERLRVQYENSLHECVLKRIEIECTR